MIFLKKSVIFDNDFSKFEVKKKNCYILYKRLCGLSLSKFFF